MSQLVKPKVPAYLLDKEEFDRKVAQDRTYAVNFYQTLKEKNDAIMSYIIMMVRNKKANDNQTQEAAREIGRIESMLCHVQKSMPAVDHKEPEFSEKLMSDDYFNSVNLSEYCKGLQHLNDAYNAYEKYNTEMFISGEEYDYDTIQSTANKLGRRVTEIQERLSEKLKMLFYEWRDAYNADTKDSIRALVINDLCEALCIDAFDAELFIVRSFSREDKIEINLKSQISKAIDQLLSHKKN